MRTVVGVLRGGPSSEYEVSLKSGSGVLQHLDKEKYEPRDIFIDRTGQWHSRGVPMNLERALTDVDVVFNALHGAYGGGSVQRSLATLGVSHTGSGALAATQARQRSLARQAAQDAGAKVPYAITVNLSENIERDARRLFRAFPLPLAVISDRGVFIAEDYFGLERALNVAQSPNVLIEEYIPGRASDVGVVERFRGEKTYALIPVPGDFSHAQKDELGQTAKAVHEALGLAHYSLMHFSVTPRGIYFMKADAQPELHDEATMSQALGAVGAPMPHFLDHVIQLARNE